jgi:hypothetical protein
MRDPRIVGAQSLSDDYMVEAVPFAAGAVAGADNATSHPLTANAAKAMIRATPILLTGRDMTAPFLPDPLTP